MFHLRLLLLSGTLLGGLGGPAGLVQAQTAPQAKVPPVQGTELGQRRTQNGAVTDSQSNTAKPLTDMERQMLKALFTKVRPATLRIEQCVPTNCVEPDGIGSAVLISADGLALTAYHVVARARTLSAQTLDKKRYPVEVVGYSDQDDLALLRVAVPRGTPFLPLAASGPSVGDALLAVGNGGGAFLLDKSGRLTGVNADAGRADFPPGTLQMNAPLVPGDSGGPVLNTRGEVTGVVSYISLSRAGDSASFAVPVTASDTRLAELRQGVKKDAPVIGIYLSQPFDALFALDAENFKRLSGLLKLGDTPGAFFTSLSPGGPAEKAGLKPLVLNDQSQRVSGDIVTAVNGKRILNFSEFQYAVRAYAPGDTIILTVRRDERTLQVKVTLTGSSEIGN
ncbi:serine protease [Deinococcus aerophilus]|uniref:Serine protease n=2 Tax=Deinococcus aerophilus TaxID=522488 RepID=A0ABQ2GIC6_9DEIO|nr:serine protease [Deinococcus aerophilus]